MYTTKQKQTHTYRKQTSGYHGEREKGRGKIREEINKIEI